MADTNTQTYTYLYLLQFDPDSGNYVVISSPSATGGPFAITETDANPDDNLISTDGTANFSNSGATVPMEYTGVTVTFNSDTYPVWLVANGDYLLFTDDASIQQLAFSPPTSASPYALCLTAGTLIRMAGMVSPADQFRPVEHLAVGDSLRTPSGPRAVRFIGRTTRVVPELRATGRMPIRIEAGALGDLGPDAPIHCTPSHAFLIGGCLVEAQALINGSTIRQLESWEEPTVTYYSIELEEHGLVWANGLLSETYFANVRGKGFSRESWDNYADFVALYGEGEPMKELELPRIPFSRQLPAAIRELAGVPDPAEAETALYALS